MPQRPSTVRLSSATFSDWIAVNRMTEFALAFAVEMSSNGNLTYSVQHTLDDLWERTDCRLSRSTTSLTVNKTNHGLSANDWVQISGSPGGIWDGEYAVASITSQNAFVVTVADSGVTSGRGWVQTARVMDHPEIDDETASADGNYEFPPRAVRLIITVWTAGYADLTVIQAGK